MKLSEFAAVQGGTVWAIPEERLDAAGKLELGEPLQLAGGRAQPREASSVTRIGNVAVIALEGLIFSRIELGRLVRSPEGFRRDLQQAVADPEVDAVVIDVSSPGGAVWMLADTHEKLMGLRGQKPIVAVVESMAFSAAYWLVSAADQIVVAPSAQVGSIGVLTQHVDFSAALDAEGINVTIIQRPDTKAERHPAVPLSDDALAHIQAQVDEAYERFVADVAKGRGVAVGTVKSDFSPGRVEEARRAVALGMADEIGTLEDTILRLQAQTRSGTGRSVRVRRQRFAIA